MQKLILNKIITLLMIMEELAISEAEAWHQLLLLGSVNKVLQTNENE